MSTFNFVTYDELLRDSRAFARTKCPRDIVGVLGVPRSGMMPAAIVAQELGCHLGDVHMFARSGEFMRPGRRMSWDTDGAVILVLDDSMYAGAAMEAARTSLRANPFLRARAMLKYGAIYVTPDSASKVDLFQRIVDPPRLFEWNWLHGVTLEGALCDMDGIFCVDPDTFDDDGPEYERALLDAQPLNIPRRKVGAIATGRIERWRAQTELWLRRQRVEYGTLFMAPFNSAQQRRDYGVAKWKAEVYATSPMGLFIESNPEIAKEVEALTERPVLCIEPPK